MWRGVSLGLAVALCLLGCGTSDDDSSTNSNASVTGPAGGSGGQAASVPGTGLNNNAVSTGTGGSTGASNHTGSAGAASGSGMPGGGGSIAGMGGTMPGGMITGAGGATGGGMMGTGTGGTGGGDVDLGPTGGPDPTIPMPKGDCPMIATGSVSVMGATVQVWTGTGTTPGPIMIYWHGTGGVAATAVGELDPTLVSEIMGTGGVIISMESGGQGNPIDWGVYTTGDYDIVDQLVACSVQQLHIDTHRIYTGGASAGGLAAGTMAFARSSYLAAANPNSGGVAPWPGLTAFQDMSHIPAVFTMHGGDADMVVISFGQASLDEDNAISAAGGFAVDCNHGGGHVAAPPDLIAAGWEFMKAHPFNTKPSPYAGGLPATFPSYCTIISK